MRSTRRILAALTGGLLLAAPAAPALAGGNPPTRTQFEIVLPALAPQRLPANREPTHSSVAGGGGALVP